VFRSIHHAVVLLPTLLLFVVVGKVQAEEWTNLRGTNTVSAELVGIWNGRALLRLDSGRQVSVHLDDLNAASRIRAQNMQESIERKLRERVSELDAIATEAAAPAPATSPTTKPAPAYVPPPDNADLQAWLNHVQRQATAGHLLIYYDALPTSQQAQAEVLFKEAIQKLDPNHWELVRTTLLRVSDVIVNKQRWLFSHPRLEGLTDAQRSMLLDLATAFRTLGQAENASIDKLRSGTLSDAMTTLDEAVSPYVYQFLSQNSMLATLLFPSYTVETGQGGKMIAKIVLPIVGTVQTVPMVQIEGRWAEGTTPEDAQAKWDGYKKSLDAVAAGSLRLGTVEENLVQNLSALVSKLEAAQNRNAFHRAFDEGAGELLTAINAWAGVRARTNAYGDDYGSDGYGPDDSMSDGDGSERDF
jgi:hypothetical protein